MNPEVRKRLQEKFGNVRTGGKGTVRRKKKKRSVMIDTRKTPEEKEFINMIKNNNESINKLHDEHLELWTLFFEDWVMDLVMNFRKKDFVKKSKLNVEYVRENYQDVADLIVGFDSDKDDSFMFINNYKYFKQNLSDKGYNYFYNSIYEIPKIIKNKDYVPKDEDKKIDNVDELLELLHLPKGKKPDKNILKKAYLKQSSINHPDKHPDEYQKYNDIFSGINNAYHDLLKHYFNEQKNSKLEIN